MPTRSASPKNSARPGPVGSCGMRHTSAALVPLTRTEPTPPQLHPTVKGLPHGPTSESAGTAEAVAPGAPAACGSSGTVVEAARLASRVESSVVRERGPQAMSAPACSHSSGLQPRGVHVVISPSYVHWVHVLAAAGPLVGSGQRMAAVVQHRFVGISRASWQVRCHICVPFFIRYYDLRIWIRTYWLRQCRGRC